MWLQKGIIDNKTSVRKFIIEENCNYYALCDQPLQQRPTKYCLILKAKFSLRHKFYGVSISRNYPRIVISRLLEAAWTQSAIYEYVHDIIYAWYKFWCTREILHIWNLWQLSWDFNEITARRKVIFNFLSSLSKTQCINGHYETNSHLQDSCGICLLYNMYTIYNSKYTYTSIYLSFK